MSPPPPPHETPRVRWRGPTAGPEFAPCRAAVERDAQLVDEGADLTVLACPRPLADTTEAASLVETAGAGGLVQLLGVWCEGEGRTGRTVEGAQRVFWHAWPAWWRRWLVDRRGAPAGDAALGLVRVDTPDAELARALVTTLEAQLVPAVWRRRAVATRPAAILWDGAQLGGREADALAGVCAEARGAGAPVIALLDFPRPETVAAARAIGAAAVLGKPVDSGLLVDSLRDAVAKRRMRERVVVATSLTQGQPALTSQYDGRSGVAA